MSILGFGILLASVSLAGASNGIVFKIALNKDTYVLGEPFTITMNLSSMRPKASVRGGLSVDNDWVLWIRHESENEYRPYVESHMDIISTADVEIPKQGLTLTLFMAQDNSRAFYVARDTNEKLSTFFSNAGLYCLKAEFRGCRPPVQSNIVTVRVVVPEGNDADAWNSWKDPEVIAVVHERTFFNSEDQRHAGLAKLRRIVETFPNTIYAEYARKRLEKLQSAISGESKADATGAGLEVSASTADRALAVVANENRRTNNSWRYWCGIGAILAVIIAILASKIKK